MKGKDMMTRLPCGLLLGALMVISGCQASGDEASSASEAKGAPTAASSSTSATTASAEGQMFVVNGGDSTLSVLDLKTQAVVSTYPLTGAQFPHHVSLSPDGSTLLVAVPGIDMSQGHDVAMGATQAGAIYKLDAKTGAILAVKKLPAMNHNAAFAPDGKTVWTSQMGMPGSVLILDAGSLATLQTIAVDHMPEEVSFSSDGKLAFAANEMSNTVSIIDVATQKVAKTLSISGGPVGAWRGPNNRMYVDSEQGKTVTVIDAGTQAIAATIKLGFTPGMVAIAADGKMWVTNSDAGAVAIFDVASGTQVSSIPTAAGAHGVAFTPDGTMAVVTNQADGSVTLIATTSLAPIKTLRVGAKPNGLVFRAL